jgi:ABC-2 type transport system ATP-binding protein
VTDAVETRALRKRYGSHVALDGVDLSVPSGTIYGFLGPNGSGKTTTMRILLGLLRADAGSARVLGADAWAEGPRLRADVGYLPSAPGLHGRMRGAHALEHFSRLDRRPPVLRAAACRALRLSDADLARPIRAYSRGMRQKLAIVGAVQHDPRLLVMDEPTEGLDPLVQDGFLELLRDRRSAGRTVLLSSHVLSEVEALCDRLAIVRAGRIVGEGTIAELRGGRPRRVAVTLRDGTTDPELPGADLVSRVGARLTLRHTGPPGPLLAALAALDPVDVTIDEPPLEEIFLDAYRESGEPVPAGPDPA